MHEDWKRDEEFSIDWNSSKWRKLCFFCFYSFYFGFENEIYNEWFRINWHLKNEQCFSPGRQDGTEDRNLHMKTNRIDCQLNDLTPPHATREFCSCIFHGFQMCWLKTEKFSEVKKSIFSIGFGMKWWNFCCIFLLLLHFILWENFAQFN